MVFAAILFTIGIWGIASSRFVAIWAPGPQPMALRLPMVTVCSVVSIASGAGLVWRRSATAAARLLLGFLCLWLVWCKGGLLVRSPANFAAWESVGETAVVISAAWALSQATMTRAPQILYGLALIAFGASHFADVTFTASLVPSKLPWHDGWVYFTGSTYITAGIALVLGRLVIPAAIMSAVQMASFGMLVWLPKIVAGARNMDTLNEATISFALAASGWVLASSVRERLASSSPDTA